MNDEKRQQIQELLAKINKRAGATIIGRSDQLRNAYFTRRPSGIIQLDRDLGGGLPGGSIVCVSGADGAGKSYLAQKACGMNQRVHGENSTILYVPTEHAFDHFHARRIGFVVAVPDEEIAQRNEHRKALGLPPYTKEEIRDMKKQIGTVELVRGRYMEEMLDAVYDAAKSNLFQIIVIDSITAAQPKCAAEAKGVEDELRQGAQANALKRFLMRYFPLLNTFEATANGTTLVMTQQMVANRSKAQANPFIQKFLPDSVPSMGSYQLRHAKLVDILLKSTEIEKKEDGAGLKQAESKTLRWEISKGKAGTHEGVVGEVDFDFKSHVDSYRTVYEEGIRTGIITEVGKKKFSVTGFKALTMVSYKEFEAALQSDVDAEINLRLRILHAHGIDCLYR